MNLNQSELIIQNKIQNIIEEISYNIIYDNDFEDSIINDNDNDYQDFNDFKEKIEKYKNKEYTLGFNILLNKYDSLQYQNIDVNSEHIQKNILNYINKYDRFYNGDILFALKTNKDIVLLLKYNDKIDRIICKKNELIILPNMINLIGVIYKILEIEVEINEDDGDIFEKFKNEKKLINLEIKGYYICFNEDLYNFMLNKPLIVGNIMYWMKKSYNNYNELLKNCFNNEKIYYLDNINDLIERIKNNKSKEYYQELIQKTWNPKRFINWCLSNEELLDLNN